VAAWKLLDRKRSAVSEVVMQKRLQAGHVEFFARSYRSRLIANVQHDRHS
jgi:hypothetical protein